MPIVHTYHHSSLAYYACSLSCLPFSLYSLPTATKYHCSRWHHNITPTPTFLHHHRIDSIVTSLIVATRTPGSITSPPADLDQRWLVLPILCRIVFESGRQHHGVLAVDATPKMPATIWWKPYKRPVTRPWRLLLRRRRPPTAIDCMLPVTPWGKFVPALNALVTVAATHQSTTLRRNTEIG
jgi:hypothetical protein